MRSESYAAILISPEKTNSQSWFEHKFDYGTEEENYNSMSLGSGRGRR